jgi:hypothetical protein
MADTTAFLPVSLVTRPGSTPQGTHAMPRVCDDQVVIPSSEIAAVVTFQAARIWAILRAKYLYHAVGHIITNHLPNVALGAKSTEALQGEDAKRSIFVSPPCSCARL